MISPSIALCVTATDDAEGLRKLFENVQGYVDKVVVAISPGNNKALSVAKELADAIIVEENKQNTGSSYEKMFNLAGTDYVLLMLTDETLDYPERLKEVASRNFDVVYFPRRNWISGYQSNIGGLRDIRLRMFKPGMVEWGKALDAQGQEKKGAQLYRACECWIHRHKTIEQIREQIVIQEHPALEDNEPESVQKLQDYRSAVEEEYSRRTACGGKIRILLYYKGEAGAGDTLMTLPAIREIRRQYPEAEITYKTNQPDVLGKGKRVNEDTYECLHPAIDYVSIALHDELERPKEEYIAKFDLVIDWGYEPYGGAHIHTNSYELQSGWAGYEPIDGNYLPDWTFAKGEEKFGRNWIKQYCKTERCVGLVLTASSVHKVWPLMEDWVNAMLREYPDVSIMTFGWCRRDVLTQRYLRLMFELAKDSYAPLEDQRKSKWYDPERYISCGFIDLNCVKGLRPERKAMGLNLREQAAVFPHLDLLLTPDTGPMHIAAALEVPTIAYFNIMPPELQVKHWTNVTVLMTDYPCSPCFKQGGSICGKLDENGAPCFRTITVEMMMEVVRKKLS